MVERSEAPAVLVVGRRSQVQQSLRDRHSVQRRQEWCDGGGRGLSHHQGGAVPAEDGPVQGRDAVSGSEVQVGSSAAQNLDELAAVLQLHGQSQGTL